MKVPCGQMSEAFQKRNGFARFEPQESTAFAGRLELKPIKPGPRLRLIARAMDFIRPRKENIVTFDFKTFRTDKVSLASVIQHNNFKNAGMKMRDQRWLGFTTIVTPHQKDFLDAQGYEVQFDTFLVHALSDNTGFCVFCIGCECVQKD